MAMTADLPANQQSPRNFDGAVNSPPRNRKSLPSPWAQVVRGEPESTPAVNQVTPPSPPPASTSPPTLVSPGSTPEQSTFSDCSPRKGAAPPPSLEISVAAADTSDGNNHDNAGRPKKPAWKKPLNGVTAEVVSPVMGAVSWPALSESTKFSPKSSPSADSSPKIVVPDGSVPSPKGLVVTPHSPHKQASSNAKPNATSNHAIPTRQRSMKRGGGGGSGSGGGHSQSSFSHPPPPPPPPPPFPLFAMPPNGYGNMVPTMPDQSPREPSYRGNSWEPRPVGGFGPQPPAAVNDNRHSSRRGNFGPRGDGHYHNNFGNRRDQDRGHYGNSRDVSAQPQRSPRGFVRPPPPSTATFVPPQPVRPFPSPMGYPDLVYIPALPMEPFRGMPFITHAPPAMIVPVPEPPLPAMLVHQIEYYFSDANLIRDEYLKANMDDEGWVPVTLIAGFNRVKSMTNDIQFILDSLRTSVVVDVQDDKVRRRSDWQKWIPSKLPAESGSQASSPSSHDMLTDSLQNMTVVEATANPDSFTVESSANLEEEASASSMEAAAHLKSSRDECIDDASLS